MTELRSTPTWNPDTEEWEPNLGGGGGGSNPFPTLEADPGPTETYGLLIQAVAGFYNVYDAFIRVLDENGIHIFNLDAGGFDMKAPAGQGLIHVLFTETDTTRQGELSSRELRISAADGGRGVNISSEDGIAFSASTPTNSPNTDQVQMYYDGTPGAAKVKFRGKNDDGTTVNGSVSLT